MTKKKVNPSDRFCWRKGNVKIVKRPKKPKVRRAKKGLYLVPPHGELIATGAKLAIAKSRYVPGHRLFDLRGDWMLVSKVDGVGLGLGDMTLGEPVEVSLDEFDTKQAEHRVEQADRMRWWPECETLWEYPIKRFKSYVNPLAVDVPAGVQTVMSSVSRQDVDAGSGVKAQSDCSDETIEPVEPESDKVQPGVEEAKETTDMQEITVLLDDEQVEGEKKYAKLSEANPSLRGIKPPINLEQANLIASWADAMEAAEDGPESPWGAAIAQFKDIYEKNEAGDGWVKREKPTESKKARGDYCICEKCASVVEHKSDTPCNEIECGECDGMMRSATQAEIEAAGVQAGRAVTAAVMSGVDAAVKTEAEDEKEGRRVRQDKVGLLQKLKEELHEFLSSLGKFVSWATYDDEPDKMDESEDGDSQEFDLGALIAATGKKAIAQGSTAFAFKALDGTTWWFQWTTNAFLDREDEIFTTQTISDFVDRKENDDIKGEFWFWHTPGSKFGTVRLQAMVGRFLAQLGPFDDTAVGRAFKEFFSKYPHSHPIIAPEGWGTSHGYSYKSTDRAAGGVYHWFDIKESTVLPLRFASNPYSPMPQILQEVKQMNDEQRKAFAAVGGEDFVDLIVNIGKESTKKLEGEVAFKEVTPEQDDKAGGNYTARIKEIAKGITDEGLKGQVEVFCAKLEEAMPMAEKETDEAEKAKTDMAAMAGQLRMLAGKVGGDSGKKLTAIAEEMAQAYGKKKDTETTTEVEAEKAVEPEPEPEVNALTREEVAGAMKAIVEVLRDEIKESTKATVAEITEALKPLVDEVKSLKVADEVKVAEKAAETPAASLSSLLQSVIGNPATFVEADSKLAASGPKEAASLAANVTGIPFVDAFIGGTDQASQKPAAGGN